MLKYSPNEKYNNPKIISPFSLEKIKKGLNNKLLKEVLLQKTRDPLIKRNIPKIKEKIQLSPSDEIKLYNPKKENPNIFPFSPIISKNFPKQRPHMIFLSNYKLSRNNSDKMILKSTFLNGIKAFTRDIKISHSLMNSIITTKKNSDNKVKSVYHSEGTELGLSPIPQTHYKKYTRLSRLGSIVSLNKKYCNSQTHQTDFDYLTNEKTKQTSHDINKIILSMNSKVNINVMNSRSNGELLPNEIIKPRYLGSTLSVFEEDTTYHRVHSLDDKLKKVISLY